MSIKLEVILKNVQSADEAIIRTLGLKKVQEIKKAKEDLERAHGLLKGAELLLLFELSDMKGGEKDE